MALLELPPELLHRLCLHLDANCLRATRASCRLLATIGAEYLVPELTVYHVRESLCGAIELIRNAAIAKGIRSLCYQGDRLPEFTSFKDWNKERQSTATYEEIRNAHPSREQFRELSGTTRGERLLDRCFTKGNAIRRGQYSKRALWEAYGRYRSLLRDGPKPDEIRTWLGEIFLNCPRLDSVELTMQNELRVTTTHRVKAFQDAMIHPWGDPSKWTCASLQMQALLQGADLCRKSLRCLTVAPISIEFFTSGGWTPGAYGEVLSKVEHVQIRLNQDFFDDYDEFIPAKFAKFQSEARSRRLAQFFAQLHELRHLDLLAPYVESEAARLHLQDALGDTHWPFLRSLSLASIECTEVDLAKLLSRHQNSLHEVAMSDMLLTQGTWHESFSAFAAGSLRFLRRFALRGDFTSRAKGNEMTFDTLDVVIPNLWTLDFEEWILYGGPMPDARDPLYYTDTEDFDWDSEISDE